MDSEIQDNSVSQVQKNLVLDDQDQGVKQVQQQQSQQKKEKGGLKRIIGLVKFMNNIELFSNSIEILKKHPDVRSVQETVQILKELKKFQFFQSLFDQRSEDFQQKLMHNLRYLCLVPKQEVYREGDSSKRFYIVLKGKLQLKIEQLKSNILVIKEVQFSQGDYFGQNELFLQRNRLGTVSAINHCDLVYIQQPLFSVMLAEFVKPCNPFFQDTAFNSLLTKSLKLSFSFQIQSHCFQYNSLIYETNDELDNIYFIRNGQVQIRQHVYQKPPSNLNSNPLQVIQKFKLLRKINVCLLKENDAFGGEETFQETEKRIYDAVAVTNEVWVDYIPIDYFIKRLIMDQGVENTKNILFSFYREKFRWRDEAVQKKEKIDKKIQQNQLLKKTPKIEIEQLKSINTIDEENLPKKLNEYYNLRQIKTHQKDKEEIEKTNQKNQNFPTTNSKQQNQNQNSKNQKNYQNQNSLSLERNVQTAQENRKKNQDYLSLNISNYLTTQNNKKHHNNLFQSNNSSARKEFLGHNKSNSLQYNNNQISNLNFENSVTEVNWKEEQIEDNSKQDNSNNQINQITTEGNEESHQQIENVMNYFEKERENQKKVSQVNNFIVGVKNLNDYVQQNAQIKQNNYQNEQKKPQSAFPGQRNYQNQNQQNLNQQNQQNQNQLSQNQQNHKQQNQNQLNQNQLNQNLLNQNKQNQNQLKQNFYQIHTENSQKESENILFNPQQTNNQQQQIKKNGRNFQVKTEFSPQNTQGSNNFVFKNDRIMKSVMNKNSINHPSNHNKSMDNQIDPEIFGKRRKELIREGKKDIIQIKKSLLEKIDPSIKKKNKIDCSNLLEQSDKYRKTMTKLNKTYQDMMNNDNDKKRIEMQGEMTEKSKKIILHFVENYFKNKTNNLIINQIENQQSLKNKSFQMEQNRLNQAQNQIIYEQNYSQIPPNNQFQNQTRKHSMSLQNQNPLPQNYLHQSQQSVIKNGSFLIPQTQNTTTPFKQKRKLEII